MRLATILSNAVPDGVVGPELMGRLQASFEDGQIMELAMVCAILTGMAKLLFALDLADREDACRIWPSGTGPSSG